ncbi:ClpP-like prohead protease/major capsid protein fusion protein [Shewanella algae]|uniref:ClpP-like prohead protease/major capsid protein fusion protein n=3 Tax=Shewanella algae TaxID=38313 RepID=UPI001AACFD4E|nr:ClpP-like prohead protease/major capsid protein fusion protein [Shewanella algae]MBO2684985.1 ATP-dependent Clp protease proteolytic subunit [Shewanella algae]MDO8254809.1 ATP-dependent Clp protease proteolytic subunit [Shewanella algae]
MKRTHLAAACATALTSAALIAPQGALTPTNKPDKSWYSLKAAANGEAELMIYDEIGGWGITAKQFARDLKDLGKITQLTARIHSPGGDVFEGMAIYNILKNYPAHKVAHIDGLAASMASVIAMAFDEVVMPENAMMMVHKPWGGTMGDADDMRKYADLLDKVEGNLVGAYRDKTGMTDEQLHALLAEETWLTGREAVEKGFADTLTEPLAMAASLQSNRMKDYANMPKALQILLAPQANSANPQNVPTPAPVNQPAPSPAPSAQPTQEQINAAAAELNRTRVDGLNTLFASWPQFAELKNECIADVEMTAEKAKDKILAKLGENTTPAAAQPRSVIIHAGNGNIVGDSIRAQLMARAGYAEREKDNGYTSYGLLELARASLTDRGISVAGYDKMGMVGLAFTHSSSDFGNILLDVSNKSVLMGWEQAEESFERIAYKGQLGDFKVARRIGLNEFGSLRQVREGAEYKHITTSDHGQSIALATYGEIFSITRQTIVNDDMDMLTRVPMMMGAAGKGTIGDLFWAVLTSNAKMGDGKALFHADHGNLGSGAPSVEALSAGRKNMRLQKSGGRNLNIRTEFVLCPVALEDTFNQIIKSTSVKGTDANSGVANPVKDMAEVIGEPRLDDHSAVEWYLAAGQGRDTIEVAYLDGIDKPYIEQLQGFNIDGIATKVRIDAGVAARDYRGLYKSSGQ